MRIMLFGASGQLGSECVLGLHSGEHDLIPLTRADVDFSDGSALVDIVMLQKPDIVVNACAYTAVDKAEDESAIANQINHLSVNCLANVCRDIDAVLLHISTDYVFDGQAKEPYTEDAPVNPLNVYGKTKLLGENALLASGVKAVILRTSWVFGKNGNNFVNTMLMLGAKRDHLSIVDDQYGCPTYTGHIVEVIIELIQRYQQSASLPWGIYHCSSAGVVSWFQFAQAIFEQALEAGLLTLSPVIKGIPSSAYPTPAPRPAYSVMNTRKLETLLGRSIPSWNNGLRDFFAD
ncbi:dTDP-4-dehydrorhamnose reductase [Candidatus Endobugula sertula]|uniref:dTDP-4-dehydrorhamnose reductase n=1 Tax=Candidatus Endobugula sertula TaxID=62101 RepID=A0A1D2QNK0_9GAMM|nr:dTDP-4-dehydrorhamnose reductase [Candidatus Endobugula sertula]